MRILTFGILGLVYAVGVYALTHVLPYTAYYYLQAVMSLFLTVLFFYYERGLEDNVIKASRYVLVSLAWYQGFWAVRDTILPVSETMAGEWIIALFPFVRGLYSLLCAMKGYVIDNSKRLAFITVYFVFFGLLVLYYFKGAANWAILIMLVPVFMECIRYFEKENGTGRFITYMIGSLVWYQGGLALWRNLEKAMDWAPLYGHPLADIVLLPFNTILFLFCIHLITDKWLKQT